VPLQLMQGERPILVTRQHWSVMAPAIVAAIVLLCVVIAILALVPDTIAGRDVSGVKLIAGIVCGVVVMGWAGAAYLRWRFARYTLTDRRIVLESGVLSRLTESISLDRIQNAVIRRPLGDRLIGAGNIHIESAGRDGVETLHRIPRAEAFYATLLQAVDALRAGPPREVGV
jgi:uncharacterized membrane protein YdbT with pleckstrin-like domain